MNLSIGMTLSISASIGQPCLMDGSPVLTVESITYDDLLVGSTLTAHWRITGGASVDFRWTRAGVPIDGETNSTYTLTEADAGLNIRFEARWHLGDTTGEWTPSDPVTAAALANAQIASATLNNSGSVANGTIVRVVSISATGNPPPTFTYQWNWSRNGGAETGSGGTSDQQTVSGGDYDTVWWCAVTASNPESSSVDSNTVTVPGSLSANARTTPEGDERVTPEGDERVMNEE